MADDTHERESEGRGDVERGGKTGVDADGDEPGQREEADDEDGSEGTADADEGNDAEAAEEAEEAGTTDIDQNPERGKTDAGTSDSEKDHGGDDGGRKETSD